MIYDFWYQRCSHMMDGKSWPENKKFRVSTWVKSLVWWDRPMLICEFSNLERNGAQSLWAKGVKKRRGIWFWSQKWSITKDFHARIFRVSPFSSILAQNRIFLKSVTNWDKTFFSIRPSQPDTPLPPQSGSQEESETLKHEKGPQHLTQQPIQRINRQNSQRHTDCIRAANHCIVCMQLTIMLWLQVAGICRSLI